ncbi:MAG TPA: hypothetical protein VHF51_08280 [Solirubrobacteraceae bacterium]|nr:hypothetical protein [Solirubrobacteraceae bacterium]
MTGGGSRPVPPWMLFALPAAIVVPVVAGILLAGPAVGAVVAAVLALAIVTVAIRSRPPGQAAEPPTPAAERRVWTAAAARRMLVPVAIAVAGIVIVLAGGGGTLTIVGWGVIGIALTVAVSLVFLEVGYSEDRARARGTDGAGSARRGDRGTAR